MTAGSVRRPSTGAVLIVCGVLLLALVAGFAWAASRVWTAQREFADVADAAASLSDAVDARDAGGLDQIAARLEAEAADAAAVVADPTWAVAELMPGLGANLTAVRIVAEQVQALSATAVTPLASLAVDAATAGGDGGTVDLSFLAGAHAPMAKAAAALSVAQRELAGVDRSGLISPVATGVAQVQELVDAAAPATAELADAAGVLPGLLGAEEPRTILVMLQNNAELRSGGGITGSFVLLEASGGAFSLVEQADSGQFPIAEDDMVELPETATVLYGDTAGRFVQNASMPTDFALSAELAVQWWRQRGGDAPDAVVSIDPIVVQALLAATGPVPLDDRSELTADNLVQRLLVDPYLTLDSEAQTVFLTRATDALFTQLLTRVDSPLLWAQALATPVAEGRISVWSAHPDEQAVIEGTALAGPLARHAAAGEDAFAVYFNDATGGKMDSYLDVAIAAGSAVCRTDGRPEVLVRVTMGSTAPEGAGDILPRSMTGGGLLGTGSGDIGTSVSVAAPAGMFFGGVRKNGEREVSADVDDGGFPTSLVRVNLSPGEVNTLEFRFVAATTDAVEPTILHTPMLTSPELTTGIEVACG